MKKNRFFLVLILLGALFMASPFELCAQSDKALLRELSEDNKKSIEALALYPPDVRLNILEATKYPEVLIKMQNLRDKTSTAFQRLIEDYTRDEQAVFYDLTRYPGLIATLADHRQDADMMRQSLIILPETDRAKAEKLVVWNGPLFVKIDNLNQTSASALDQLFGNYPAPAQRALRSLLDLPEVVDILNDDLRFTVLVGDVYKENPAWVLQKVDSLNLVVARNHADELENWKQTVENDPAAKTELQAAAREYADEYGYEEDYYNRPSVAYTYYAPYPYWYGYPWWEPYPRWRPYPYWWDWGCNFYNPTVVVYYMPSYHFMHWYFDRPNHHTHYNHLSTKFVNHYGTYRRSGTTITEGVREWHERNGTVVSEDFISDKNKLPQRLKEYGQFEKGRQDRSKKDGRNISQDEFLTQNTKKYPEMTRTRATVQTEAVRQPKQDVKKNPVWAPEKEPVITRPQPSKTTEPVRPPRDQTVPVRQQPVDPVKRQQPAKDTPTDYHRQKWETPKQNPAPKRIETPQRVDPKSPRSQTQPATQPKPQQTRPSTTPVQKNRGNKG